MKMLWKDITRAFKTGTDLGESVSAGLAASSNLSQLFARYPDEAKETLKLHREVLEQWNSSELATTEPESTICDIVCHAVKLAGRGWPSSQVVCSLRLITHDLMGADGLLCVPDLDAYAARPEDFTLTESAKLRTYLRRQRRFLSNFTRYNDIWQSKLAYLYGGLLSYLPESAFDDSDENKTAGATVFPLPLLDLMPDVAECVERLIVTFGDEDVRDTELFEDLYTALTDNVYIANGVNPALPEIPKKPLVFPTAARINDPNEVIYTYLNGTPFPRFFESDAEFEIKDSLLFEHVHIVGGSGHGKTQLLNKFIMHAIERAEKDEAGFIIIDSQGDLINLVSHQQCFSPEKNPKLAGKVLIVDPKDIEYPPCLNMFDLGIANLDDLSPADRMQIQNTATDLFEYMFSALVGITLTGRQAVVFRYIAQLMMEIKDANIFTLQDLLEEPARFCGYFPKLSKTARKFFEQLFVTERYKQAREQLLERIYGVLATPMFEQMFDNRRNKVNIADAMNNGNIIFISTNKNFFGETGCQIFGRFWLALIFQATLSREPIPEEKRKPCTLFLDEAYDYFDPKLQSLLVQARKFKLGMLIAHQFLDQLEPTSLRSSILSCTRIKLVGGLNDKDRNAFAREMQCEPELLNKPKNHYPKAPLTEFACHIKGVTTTPALVTVELRELDNKPKMSEREYAKLIAMSRTRVSLTDEERREQATEREQEDEDEIVDVVPLTEPEEHESGHRQPVTIDVESEEVETTGARPARATPRPPTGKPKLHTAKRRTRARRRYDIE